MIIKNISKTLTKKQNLFKKSIVLLIKHFIFAPSLEGLDLVAQLVEHFTFNERVPGSSPGQVTRESKTHRNGGFLFLKKIQACLRFSEKTKSTKSMIWGFAF